MALPVPYDGLIVPIMTFNPSQPPYIPLVRCPPGYETYLPFIAAQLANELGTKAHLNASRLFTYNLNAQNSFNNPYWHESLELCVWFIFIQMQKRRFQDISQAISTCADEMSTLITSRNVYEFPELKSVTPASAVHSASMNYGTLNTLKQEISMYQNQFAQVQQPMMQQPMMPQQPMMHQPMGYPQPMIPQQPFFGGQPQMGYQQPMMNAPTMVGGFGQSMPGIVNNQDQQQAINERFTRASPPMETIQKPAEEPVVKTPVSIVKPLQEVEMDRTQHTILFAGGEYHLNRYERERVAIKNVENMIYTQPKEEDNNYVYPTVLFTHFLEDAIFESRVVQKQKQQHDFDGNVYRFFGFISKTFLTGSQNYHELFENLFEPSTIAEIGHKLRSISRASATLESNDINDVMNIVQYYDRRITSLVNRYLRTEMELDVTIDTIIEDSEGLYKYLAEKGNLTILKQFEKWEPKLCKHFTTVKEDEEEKLKQAILQDPSMQVFMIPEAISITLLNMFDRELGFKLADQQTYRIDDFRHELLYKLASSLSHHEAMMEHTPSTNYLVTLDDVKYTLHESVKNPGQYLIRKA